MKGPVALLLLISQLGSSLVCHECGVPGAMTCEDVTRAKLLVAVRCDYGTCVATSFTYLNGEEAEARFCNRKINYPCSSAMEVMNYDTCETCSTDFCNGPLPACDRQLHYVSTCVRPMNIVVFIVVAVTLLGVFSIGVCCCKIYQKRRQRLMAHIPLVSITQQTNTIHTMQYTHI